MEPRKSHPAEGGEERLEHRGFVTQPNKSGQDPHDRQFCLPRLRLSPRPQWSSMRSSQELDASRKAL